MMGANKYKISGLDIDSNHGMFMKWSHYLIRLLVTLINASQNRTVLSFDVGNSKITYELKQTVNRKFTEIAGS